MKKSKVVRKKSVEITSSSQNSKEALKVFERELPMTSQFREAIMEVLKKKERK